MARAAEGLDVNDVSPLERNSSDIKRDLRRRRSELQVNLKRLFRGRNTLPIGPGEPVGKIGRAGNGASMPVLSIAAGAALVGVFLLRRRLFWPLRLAGRFVELAAPVVVPVLVRRIAEETPPTRAL